MKNEQLKLHAIGNGVSIYASSQHPFGTDAVLLADFASAKSSDTACDLGAGCGIIPFLWARKNAPRQITAVELQENAVALMHKSIAHNAFEQTVRVVQGDIRQPETLGLEAGSFTLVSMNPPYTAVDAGLPSRDESQNLARHRLTCTTEDIMRCAKRLLQFSGRLCICQKPEHLADLMEAMRQNGIEPKRLRFVSGRQGKAPYLVLLEGRRGGSPGLTVLPELHIHRADGSWSDEMLEIYGDYGDGTKQ